MGTRFLVADECTVHPNYKKRVLDARDTDTVVTGRSTGHPVRVLKNKLSRQFEQLENQGASIEALEELGSGKLPLAARDGDIDHGSVMAGQIAGLVKRAESAEEIIRSSFEQAMATLQRLNADFTR